MSNYMDYAGGGVETIKRHTRVAYGWLVVGRSVIEGLACGLEDVRPLYVT